MSDQAKHVLRLFVREGPDQGREFLLAAGKPCVVGRGRKADMRLTDGAVSHRHCIVRAAGDMAMVEDLGSGNGTLVNGKTEALHALDGDGVIEIGQSVIELAWIGRKQEAPLPPQPSAPVVPQESGLPSASEAAARQSAPADTPTVTMRVPTDECEAPAVQAAGEAPAVQDAGEATTVQDAGETPAAQAAGLESTVVGFAPQAGGTPAHGKGLAAAMKLVGTRVASYRLESVLGLGGMGAVYGARDVYAGISVAVKLIQCSQATSLELLRRFVREARTGMALNHPNVVRTLGSGEDGPYAYIVMELVQGRDVASLLDEGRRFRLGEVVAIGLPICDALSSAHVQGIIHRDIKPANIMLTPAGQPKLLDLGLAKKIDEKGQSILTATGDVMGTPSYMSPEQATDSKHVDGRSDIYSLAATLYAMLSQRPPFDGRTSIEILRKVRSTDAPLVSALRPDVPEAFAQVIAKAMAKDPEERHSNMVEFAQAIRGAAPHPAGSRSTTVQ